MKKYYWQYTWHIILDHKSDGTHHDNTKISNGIKQLTTKDDDCIRYSEDGNAKREGHVPVVWLNHHLNNDRQESQESVSNSIQSSCKRTFIIIGVIHIARNWDQERYRDPDGDNKKQWFPVPVPCSVNEPIRTYSSDSHIWCKTYQPLSSHHDSWSQASKWG